MRPDPRFLDRPMSFWAMVRLISEQIGYSHSDLTLHEIVERLDHVEAQLSVKVVDGVGDFCEAVTREGKSYLRHKGRVPEATRQSLLDLDSKQRKGWRKNVDQLYERSQRRPWIRSDLLLRTDDVATELGNDVCEYLNYRQTCLKRIKPCLMNKSEAQAKFAEIRRNLSSNMTVPKNKQKGEKAGDAYLTGIVMMIINDKIDTLPCDYDPQSLTTFLSDGTPVLTTSRRLDGAFPSTVNPVAVWELKEYYNSKTFGSRVAGGVYETTLDGMELKQMHDSSDVQCAHYIFVDDRKTWWDDGRSYLCRFVDILHMGYVDEVLFGREVETRLPELVDEWMEIVRARQG
jgi:hypothetical protein